MTLPIIYGFEGTTLTDFERGFFKDTKPWGYILFARNIESRDQTRRLVDALYALDGRAHVPILIDQEGGRVARLRPPLAYAHPPAQVYGDIYRTDPTRACRAVALGAEIIARELADYGATLNAMPCLDLACAVPTDIIGDRAYSDDVAAVVALGVAATQGLKAGGVLAIAKHAPGHGRARCDSHDALPIIDADRDTLLAHDFEVFRRYFDALKDETVLAMSGHLLFSALDKERVSTLSPIIIELIRSEIGFDGVLMSDDISMNALAGDYASRTRDALQAGCDLILHCNGARAEMVAIAESAAAPSQAAQHRFTQVEIALAESRRLFDSKALQPLRAEWLGLMGDAYRE